jgi:hypothetical protein
MLATETPTHTLNSILTHRVKVPNNVIDTSREVIEAET